MRNFSFTFGAVVVASLAAAAPAMARESGSIASLQSTSGLVSTQIIMDDAGFARFYPALENAARNVGDTPVNYWHASVVKGNYRINVYHPGSALVCVAVDGRNVVSGEKLERNFTNISAWEHFGKSTCYVSYNGPIDFKGWRTDSNSVRKFVFTSVENSAAAKYFDDVSAVGTLVIAVFPEKKRVFVPAPSAGTTRGAPESGPAARSASPSLGTGAGARVESKVTSVHFESQSIASNAIVIHYATQQTLVQMGVVPSPAATKPTEFGRFDKKDCDRSKYTGIPSGTGGKC